MAGRPAVQLCWDRWELPLGFALWRETAGKLGESMMRPTGQWEGNPHKSTNRRLPPAPWYKHCQSSVFGWGKRSQGPWIPLLDLPRWVTARGAFNPLGLKWSLDLQGLTAPNLKTFQDFKGLRCSRLVISLGAVGQCLTPGPWASRMPPPDPIALVRSPPIPRDGRPPCG